MAEGQPTYLYVVCSTHPRVGKTLMARLLIEFQRANERPVLGFDLGSNGPALAEFLPEHVFHELFLVIPGNLTTDQYGLVVSHREQSPYSLVR